MVALLATGASEETASSAKTLLKTWFESRFNMGSKASGADHWTFLLCKSAALSRLHSLGDFLNIGVYVKEKLGENLGCLTKNWTAAGRDCDGVLLEGRQCRLDVLRPLLAAAGRQAGSATRLQEGKDSSTGGEDLDAAAEECSVSDSVSAQSLNAML